ESAFKRQCQYAAAVSAWQEGLRKRSPEIAAHLATALAALSDHHLSDIGSRQRAVEEGIIAPLFENPDAAPLALSVVTALGRKVICDKDLGLLETLLQAREENRNAFTEHFSPARCHALISTTLGNLDGVNARALDSFIGNMGRSTYYGDI